jgi:succinyl-CoA synthetase beta subunit
MMRKKKLNKISRRKLNIHEYQGHQVMKSFGINVPNGWVAKTPAQAEYISSTKFGENEDIIVKAQILAGGRGKGHFTSGLQGGVHVCLSPKEVKEVAKQMLGHKLITIQTGSEGKPVNSLYLCERRYIRRETYLAITLDREAGGPIVIASPKGGVNIEQLAHDEPSAIFREPIDITIGITDDEANRIAEALKFNGELRAKAADQIKKLYKLFIDKDATIVEVNPFVETSDGNILCLDAKLNFDPNAIFRHEDIYAMRDESQLDSREMEAQKSDLNYIGLDGNIACLVNGAGLAMATMDIISHYGGSPANFLDIGGGASDQQVADAFRILSQDKQVNAILVNIFGGIMRCDAIAMGLIRAVEQLKLTIPVVVRLQGTNHEEANLLLENSGFRMIAAENLDDAAQKAVQVAQIVKLSRAAKLNVSFEIPL